MASKETLNPNAVHFADTKTLINSNIDPTSTIHGGVFVEDDLRVGTHSTIHEGATVSGKIQDFASVGRGATFIGSSLGFTSEVEPYAKVKDSIVENSSLISEAAEIDNTRIGNNSEIGRHVKASGSQIGDDVVIGARAILEKKSTVTDGANVSTGETIPTNGVRIANHQTVV